MAEINTTQLRDALAWATQADDKAHEPSDNPFVWFWEAIEGDFSESRSTSQILVDAGISMIPLVDQVCDVRDLIANCRKLGRDYKDTWAWVALVLTLIGLFPTLGSLVKGVLKIFFGFIRRSGGKQMVELVEAAMSWVISFLRRRKVQQYLKAQKVDQVFKWLAIQIKQVRGKINVGALLAAFDKGIGVLEGLVAKVAFVPSVGAKAKAALQEVKNVRMAANAHIGAALKQVQDIIDTIILRLEREVLEANHGIVDVANIHYRGALPEAAAVALMRKRGAPWLSKKGDNFLEPVDLAKARIKVADLSAAVDPAGVKKPLNEIFPKLSDQNIQSFHTLAEHVVHGPARLYRVLAPNSRAMSDCWVTQEVFERLQAAAHPKDAWRKFLAVWPDWNVDGQFVIYDVKAGETLNTWKGIASSQEKEMMPGLILEGGYEQLVFKVGHTDPRNDLVRYYPVKNAGGNAPKLGASISRDEFVAGSKGMNRLQEAAYNEKYLSIRHTINHPNISGPFSTGWGYDEFDGAGLLSRLGLPALPAQVSK
jgi:hypothetical protein